jgi:hypothetical protein
LPPDQGAVVAAAIERAAESVPPMPDEDGPFDADARRADALVALCSSRIAADPDPDRATVVVHVRADGPGGIHGPGEPASPAGSSPPRRIACEIEGGPVIHPETAARLSCTARVQAIAEDASGQPVFVGRMQRTPPAWMMRQLRYRDRECTFPGCGARRHTHAHHLVFWEDGGETDLSNLALVCPFHHRLVHEHGWRLGWDPDGTPAWYRPDGTRFLAGPGPPDRATPTPEGPTLNDCETAVETTARRAPPAEAAS